MNSTNHERKRWNQRGFTLAEMLVVVAIIAVLVSISVPVFTNKVEKAREAADMANMRSARTAALVECMDGALEEEKSLVFYYSASEGTLKEWPEDALPAYGQGKDAKGRILKVTVRKRSDGTDDDWAGAAVELEWIEVQ